MKVPNHYDEMALQNLLEQQQQLAWDPDRDINWSQGIDFSKPFVPLDEKNIIFPQVTPKERLVISQFMGMIIAATFSEMELAMQRLREVCWRPLMKKYATSPELIALGEEFFDEEVKHAHVFQKFLNLCANFLNIDPDDLKNILPKINSGYVEKILRHNAGLNGVTLWWIVATVEEESTLLFRQIRPFKDQLDPLYYRLHQRHFEEEARHAPYPFIMLELGKDHMNSVWQKWLRKSDFLISEVLKMFWLFFELAKSLEVSHLKNHHDFFQTLHGLKYRLKDQSLMQLFSSLIKETPYISLFINPLYHQHTKKTVKKLGMFELPFPEPHPLSVSWAHESLDH